MSVEEEWYRKQDKRLGREKELTVVLAGITGIVGWVSSTPILFIVTIGLPLMQHIRSRAVNTEEKEFAENRLAITNPFLILGALSGAFYLVAQLTIQTGLATTVFWKVVLFSFLCIGIGFLIFLIEHFSNSLYFDWWSERAMERAYRKNSKFWIWIAGQFKALSPKDISDKELFRNKKRVRAQQRKNPTKFQPTASEHNPPSFERAYLIRLLQELLAWKRSVPIGAGIVFLYVQGSGILMAFAGSFLLWLGTSFLADHVKYMYYFRPVEDGIYNAPNPQTQKDRFLQAAQSYWVANILGICIVWLILI